MLTGVSFVVSHWALELLDSRCRSGGRASGRWLVGRDSRTRAGERRRQRRDIARDWTEHAVLCSPARPKTTKGSISPWMRGHWRPGAVHAVASSAVARRVRVRQSRCAAMKLYLDAGRENAGRRGIIGGHAHLCCSWIRGLILVLNLILTLRVFQILSVQRLHGVSWGARQGGTLARDQRWRRRGLLRWCYTLHGSIYQASRSGRWMLGAGR